jgi:hypothetical protein
VNTWATVEACAAVDTCVAGNASTTVDTTWKLVCLLLRVLVHTGMTRLMKPYLLRCAKIALIVRHLTLLMPHVLRGMCRELILLMVLILLEVPGLCSAYTLLVAVWASTHQVIGRITGRYGRRHGGFGETGEKMPRRSL